MAERVEFTDEHGRSWSGWRSDEGRIDLSYATERPADDSGVRAYTELLESGGFAMRSEKRCRRKTTRTNEP